MEKDASVTVKMTIQQPVGYHYTGGGAFLEGLPTRDMTAGELSPEQADRMTIALHLGLYEPIYQEAADA